MVGTTSFTIFHINTHIQVVCLSGLKFRIEVINKTPFTRVKDWRDSKS